MQGAMPHNQPLVATTSSCEPINWASQTAVGLAYDGSIRCGVGCVIQTTTLG